MTISQEDEAQRHKKQQWIRRQVKAGKLVVRQMTPDERPSSRPCRRRGREVTGGRDRQRPNAPRSRGPVPPGASGPVSRQGLRVRHDDARASARVGASICASGPAPG